MRLPPLNTLQAFEATARLSSLSKAGDELHVTHAAISHQIKRLEEWFGRRLFQRAGRGIELTPAGQEFLLAVDEALASLALASAKLRVVRDRKSVSVACLPSVATRWLVPALDDFTQRHPTHTVQVSYAKAHEQFDPERHDVLITHGADSSPGVNCRKLFSRVNRPVASRSLLARHPGLIQPQGIDGVTLLHDEFREAWDEWFAKAGYRPARIVQGPVYQDFNLLATAVIAGHGVALCPVEVFRREIGDGDLVVLSEVATLEDQGYYVIIENTGNLSVEQFQQWFIEICSTAHRELGAMGVQASDAPVMSRG